MDQQHLQQEHEPEETWTWIDSDNRELTVGEEHAEHAQTEDIRQLGHVLQRDTRRRITTLVLLPLMPITSLLVPRWLLSEEAWIHLCTNPVFVITALAIGIGVPLTLLKPSRKARQAASRLSTLDDVSALGGLIESLSFGHNREMDAPAQPALIRLLYRLRASDKGLITSRHAALLRETLAFPPHATGNLFTSLSRRREAHARLQIAILKAFEQVGDSRELPVVAHLAKNAANPKVRQAAEDCLQFVQARVEHERTSQTLLRAASPVRPDPAILLRPAHGDQEQAPGEMLRSSDAPAQPVDECGVSVPSVRSDLKFCEAQAL